MTSKLDSYSSLVEIDLEMGTPPIALLQSFFWEAGQESYFLQSCNETQAAEVTDISISDPAVMKQLHKRRKKRKDGKWRISDLAYCFSFHEPLFRNVRLPPGRINEPEAPTLSSLFTVSEDGLSADILFADETFVTSYVKIPSSTLLLLRKKEKENSDE